MNWHLRSHSIDTVVEAEDQFAAWDTLRDLPIAAFGLIVTAEADENANPTAIQTEQLMRRWDRPMDADLAHTAAVRAGVVAP